MGKKVEKWMQKAFKPENKGKLTEYVKGEVGSEGFTERDTIKVDVLQNLAKGKPVDGGEKVTLKTRRRAQAALNARKSKK